MRCSHFLVDPSTFLCSTETTLEQLWKTNEYKGVGSLVVGVIVRHIDFFLEERGGTPHTVMVELVV
jgi:hypothetical protein